MFEQVQATDAHPRGTDPTHELETLAGVEYLVGVDNMNAGLGGVGSMVGDEEGERFHCSIMNAFSSCI